ncbi:MAG: Glu-tRNA(Gln) amidotransferase subunit GatE [Euryarchaeota archaeon]|nr:Glu-tRNA(Gln) amidotransferase subunit GatE [Euryarchaeota archaeon]MDE1879540.1 Glu-tRNA(Gln) amidotransferase subunit GatE [Euryarchaeota archaeon]MDE2043700.1 Glu-tRNA(Gln) amidotransferase subunit GatE [Thermoplasmata archaeon]
MKAGLEIHQQLATGKLFCACASELSEETRGQFLRRLHAVAGETGAADRAAQAQSGRALLYRYEVSPHSCLVEADEEPPHALNVRALEVALTMTELLGAQVVDEVQVMRKTVVDGSNTSGFQRTALVATGGAIKVGERSYPILSICLEEDAARKVGESQGEVRYRLDRLGIPLLEIATGPEITSGTEAREVAEALGRLLRATRRVKRGIGTIREDLNVSTDGGARVEIKGVQELRYVPQFVENEVERQKLLLRVRDELVGRGARVPEDAPRDLTDVFRASTSKVVKETLAKGGQVLALPLPGFGGLLGNAKTGPERLGREFADHARAAGAGGILHSDELPAYGITQTEVDAVRAALGLASADRDAFVLVVAPSGAGSRAIEAVRGRAGEALRGVPEETRDPVLEGRTRYSRPLPGRHRMYPETDIPPLPISPTQMTHIRRHLPERPEATFERLSAKEGLGAEVAKKLLDDGEVEVFDLVVKRGISPSLAARTLTQELPPVEEARGTPIAEADHDRAALLVPILAAVAAGKFAKEGIGPVLRRVFQEHEDLETAVVRAGLSGAGAIDLEVMARKVVESNLTLLREKGRMAFQPLMGDLMASVRGQRDGKQVAEVLHRAVEERLKTLASETPAP